MASLRFLLEFQLNGLWLQNLKILILLFILFNNLIIFLRQNIGVMYEIKNFRIYQLAWPIALRYGLLYNYACLRWTSLLRWTMHANGSLWVVEVSDYCIIVWFNQLRISSNVSVVVWSCKRLWALSWMVSERVTRIGIILGSHYLDWRGVNRYAFVHGLRYRGGYGAFSSRIRHVGRYI